MPTEQEQLAACKEWQIYIDNHLQDIGGKAPPYIPGQAGLDYAREAFRTIKRGHLPPNHPLFKVQWRRLDGTAVKALAPQLMEACKQEARNPNTVPPGEFRQITTTRQDEYGVVKQIEFIGPECFVKQMGRPGRLAKIRTPDTHPGWFPKEVPSIYVKPTWPMAAA